MEITKEIKEDLEKDVISYLTPLDSYVHLDICRDANCLNVNAIVDNFPYHNDSLFIMQIDYCNSVIRFHKSNKIIFKDCLLSVKNIDSDDEVNDVFKSWIKDIYIEIPIELFVDFLNCKYIKKTLSSILKNTVDFGYGKQIIEKVKGLINEEFTEHADLELNFNAGNIHSALIKLENNPWRNGVIKGDLLFTQIKCSGNVKYLRFKKQFSYYLDELGIKYTANKTEGKVDTIRANLSDFKNCLDNPSKKFIHMLNAMFLKNIGFSEFGCCGKHTECETKRKCIHADKLYSTACQFKKLMQRSGKFENS